MLKSENASSAGNQQERLEKNIDNISEEIGYYLSGFADGEGSFNVSFKRRKDYTVGYKVSLSFNVSQKDDTIPKLYRDILRCGTIRYRKDGVCYYEVRDLYSLNNIVFPFFKRFELLSPKKKELKRLEKIAKLVTEKRHLTKAGIKKILEIRSPMNNGGKRKITDEEIVRNMHFQNPQRLYARPR
jgi:hypothetical protein